MTSRNDIIKRVNVEYAELPTLESQLPITLVNGFIINNFTGNCVNCDELLLQPNFRGKIYQAPDNAYRVSGWGCCKHCNLLSLFNYHIVPHEKTAKLITLKYRSPFSDDHEVINLF